MVETLQILLSLLIVVGAIAVLAKRLEIPPPILLVCAGVGLALVPGLPTIELAPELVLLVVLPPLIYAASVSMSWREFRFNLRPISLLAVGAVVVTTVAVATAAHYLLGLPWNVGFVLGAIVSPPDTVAPLAIARRLHIPRRIVTVLEGEGLANDATALILYRFAVAAVSIGTFHLGTAVGTFAAIVGGELAWGVAVGWAMLRIRRWVAEPRVEILLSILTPYVAFWPPETLGGSGVLATVTAGLYISWNGLLLISAATRLQGIFFWDFLIYLIEGLVFVITGLQARSLLDKMTAESVAGLLMAVAVVSAVVIVTRFLWVFPAIYVPRWTIPGLARRDPAPPWQWPFAIAFTGIRGIVSLAAALSIPLTTDSGAPFPYRDLILLLTFAVILVTLVGQGLMLPAVIRALGLAHSGRAERHRERHEEHVARREALHGALERIDEVAAERKLPRDVIEPVRERILDRIHYLENVSDGNDAHKRLSDLRDDVECLLIETEREHVNQLYRAGKIKDEARRRVERDLDLREARLRNEIGDDENE
ncbi:MAG TPA: Na+/H+ antiporter [Alphaproteobacteria bacterium]|jgi:Na+/H+ antiporter|nr:Na+/H+ antiporter [Alphaproteobacteria bacterium]